MMMTKLIKILNSITNAAPFADTKRQCKKVIYFQICFKFVFLYKT